MKSVRISEGKTTYYIKGQRFYNDKDKRNGKQKATDYCLQNFLNTNDIITFDSMLECDRYEYLKEKEKTGEIENLSHHQTIMVQSEFYNANNELIPAITYKADFIYKENGKIVVEDVKGASIFTDTRFEIMKQVFDNVFKDKNMYIKIVIFRQKEWVEWRFGEKKKSQTLIKKQRAIIQKLKQEQHNREIKDNKEKREKERIKQLQAKEKLTKKEKERLEELLKRYE